MMVQKIKSKYWLVALMGWAGLLFLPFLGGMSLFDWDEINFAECAREMLVSRQYLTVTIDFQPFWEKPPLFIGLQAVAMSLFGVNEFAARLPNALCGMLTVGLLFLIGKRLRDASFGFWWALIYTGSVLPHLYFRSGIIDPFFNLLIFLSLFCWLEGRWLRNRSRRWSMGLTTFSAIAMGLAMLTKGPVALLLGLLTLMITALLFRIYTSKESNHKHSSSYPLLTFFLWLAGAGLIFLAWFIGDFITNGACTTHDFSSVKPAGLDALLHSLPCTMAEFIVYHLRLATTEDAGHGGFFGYHFIILALGCFPAFVFAFKELFRFPSTHFRPMTEVDGQVSPQSNSSKPHQHQHFLLHTRWMFVLFWVVLIVFSIVKTKIVHYSSLAYFPVTFFAATTVWDWLHNNQRWHKAYSIYIGGVGGLVGIVLLILPALILRKEAFLPLIKDPFARENLSASVDWSLAHGWVGGLWLAVITGTLYLVHAKNQQKEKAMLVLFGGMAVAIASVIYVIVPRVEPYTQGAAIDFFKSLKGKKCYVATLHYKSYAPFFYAEVPRYGNPQYYTPEKEQWLKEGAIDMPAYFSVKINRADEYRTEKYKLLGWQELYAQNGFVFFKREVPNVPK